MLGGNMHSETNFIVNLVILLIAAGGGAYIARRLGQAKILGQIIGGVLVGPSMLHIGVQTEFISNLAEIGVILLMFLAGLETDFEELKNSFEKSTWIALGGITVPFAFGVLSVFLLKDVFVFKEAIFVGVMLTATSMGIAIQTLSELGRLKSPFGASVMGATIIDDVAGVIILAITLGIFGGSTSGIPTLLIKNGLFFIFIIWFAKFVSLYVKRNIKYLEKIKRVHLLSGSIFLVLLFGVFASEFGMAAIIGAYFIGLIISRTSLQHRIFNEIERFGNGFFIPLFFVNIGLSINLTSVGEYLYFALGITAFAILSKIIGSGIGARISGFDNKESLQVGISMIPRAEVTLIIANLGVRSGIIGNDVFTAAILLVLVSSVLTPILLKATEKHKQISKVEKPASELK
jgi:Kef-type K+ transport system membrane component KefB